MKEEGAGVSSEAFRPGKEPRGKEYWVVVVERKRRRGCLERRMRFKSSIYCHGGQRPNTAIVSLSLETSVAQIGASLPMSKEKKAESART